VTATTPFLPSPDELHRILAAAGIDEPIVTCTALEGGYSNAVLDLDDRYILRLSNLPGTAQRFARERAALERTAELPGMPRLLGAGRLGAYGTWRYLLLEKLPGQNLFRAWLDATAEERVRYAQALAGWMRGLHGIPMERYSCGYHQTALRKRPAGTSWLAGHDAYVRRLLRLVRADCWDAALAELIDAAEAYYAAHREALGYQVGPRLLHGDLQLYNVIVDRGHLTGIVDWEWAHGGEPDFDLADLARWALYPVDVAEEALEPRVAPDDFATLMPTLLDAYPEIASIPRLCERLTIYQLEYDLHKLAQAPRSPRLPARRLRGWLRDE
jgi:aminoglycoside phosphotransferase (APT) family kinase protein